MRQRQKRVKARKKAQPCMTCLAKAEAEVFPHSRNLLLALSSFCFRPLLTRARQAARSRLDPRIDWPKLHCCSGLSIVLRGNGGRERRNNGLVATGGQLVRLSQTARVDRAGAMTQLCQGSIDKKCSAAPLPHCFGAVSLFIGLRWILVAISARLVAREWFSLFLGEFLLKTKKKAYQSLISARAPLLDFALEIKKREKNPRAGFSASLPRWLFPLWKPIFGLPTLDAFGTAVRDVTVVPPLGVGTIACAHLLFLKGAAKACHRRPTVVHLVRLAVGRVRLISDARYDGLMGDGRGASAISAGLRVTGLASRFAVLLLGVRRSRHRWTCAEECRGADPAFPPRMSWW